jgi:hypothetical protein
VSSAKATPEQVLAAVKVELVLLRRRRALLPPPTPATGALPAVPATPLKPWPRSTPASPAQKSERPRDAVPLRPPVMTGGSREPRQGDTGAGPYGGAARTGSRCEAPDQSSGEPEGSATMPAQELFPGRERPQQSAHVESCMPPELIARPAAPSRRGSGNPRRRWPVLLKPTAVRKRNPYSTGFLPLKTRRRGCTESNGFGTIPGGFSSRSRVRKAVVLVRRFLACFKGQKSARLVADWCRM